MIVRPQASGLFIFLTNNLALTTAPDECVRGYVFEDHIRPRRCR